MVAYLFGRQPFVRYGYWGMMRDGHRTVAGRAQNRPLGWLERRSLRGLREGGGCANVVTITGDCVIAPMAMAAARLSFLLDVRDFAAGRELAIAPHDASAGESGEAEKSNETHKTLTRCINCQMFEQVLCRGITPSSRHPLPVIIGGRRAVSIST
jgi:hypothetical protein